MTDRLFKKYLKYSSLNVLGMMSISGYILADTFFIAKALGASGLAALNFSISIVSVVNAFGLMIGIGGGANYSIHKSRGNLKKANEIFTIAVKMAMLVSSAIFIIGLLFSKNLAGILGAGGEIHVMANIYIKTIMLFSPFFILNNVVLCFVRNDNDPKLPMIAMVVGSISNVVLDYIFMFPLEMGMFGAVIATSIAPIISLGILSRHFLKKDTTLEYLNTKKDLFNLKIVKLGISSFITEMASAVTLIVFNLILLNQAGNLGVAAYAIIANIALVIISIYTGISQGMQPLTSQEYGIGNKHNIKKLLRYAILSSLAATAVIYLYSFFNAEFIVNIFNNEGSAKITKYAAEGVRIYFLGFFFAGINIVVSAYLASIERARESFIISVLRGVVLIVPVVLIMSYLFHTRGVWIGFVITEMIIFIISNYLIKLTNKNI
ncbi:Na+-driven multidrug efflux pump [Peptoniphilus sp. ING2-D1G]|nr:Na+-driven multidrug efflux pump [Peptoniphilus sp. ING2-D1G]